MSHHTVRVSHPSPLSVYPCYYHNSLDFLLQMPREIPDRASVFITKRFFSIIAALDKSQKLPKNPQNEKTLDHHFQAKNKSFHHFLLLVHVLFSIFSFSFLIF